MDLILKVVLSQWRAELSCASAVSCQDEGSIYVGILGGCHRSERLNRQGTLLLLYGMLSHISSHDCSLWKAQAVNAVRDQAVSAGAHNLLLCLYEGRQR